MGLRLPTVAFKGTKERVTTEGRTAAAVLNQVVNVGANDAGIFAIACPSADRNNGISKLRGIGFKDVILPGSTGL